MEESETSETIKFGLPKGRMERGITQLLADAGIHLKLSSRTYRPAISLPGFETKVLKPQDIVEMLHIGSRDLGFAGADWVAELEADVVEVLDTGLDPVKLVAAAPAQQLQDGRLPSRHLVIASEYERLTKNWIAAEGLDASFVRSFGATEVFPPEDADCIVDNTASGETLRANQLHIVATLMTSSTRLYASKKAMANPEKLQRINDLAMVIRSVLEARKRVMVEINVDGKCLDRLVSILPCLRMPTISSLHRSADRPDEEGYVVKAAVPKADLPRLIPLIKEQGGTDIVVTAISQLVP